MKRIWLFLLTCLLLLPFQVVLAQRPTPSDDEVNAVARELYCPICENVSLEVCPTAACAQWRDLIREQLAAGQTEQQIKDYFAARYGDQVLPQPPARGFGLLIYIIPPLVIAAAFFAAWRLFRKPRAAHAPQAAPADLARVEADLRRRSGDGRD